MTSSPTPSAVLKNTFGFDSFRPGQREIVQEILAGHDVLALMPTGGGKSLCFQVPGLCLEGLTIVISPLVSLMKDQVDALVRKGVKASYLHSAQDKATQHRIMDEVADNRVTFLYATPERLAQVKFRERLKNVIISLVVIDEAHCISEWGHDFRPEYRLIADFIAHQPIRPRVAAFTATATVITRHDILNSLKMIKPKVFTASFQRPGLKLMISACHSSTHKLVALARILKLHPHQCCIIYCATRQATEQLANFLRATIFSLNQDKVRAYHAGLDNEEKDEIQRKFLNDELQLVVATNALGMGIDKSNIRVVIHYHFPASLEHYLQEIGRAGRDGKPGTCYLLFSAADLEIHQSLMENKPGKDTLPKQKLQAMIKYATTKHCRNFEVISYFDEVVAKYCDHCDNCLRLSVSASALELKRKKSILQLVRNYQRETGLLQLDLYSQRLAAVIAAFGPNSTAALSQLPGIGNELITSLSNFTHQIVSVCSDQAKLRETDTAHHQQSLDVDSTRASPRLRLPPPGPTFSPVPA